MGAHVLLKLVVPGKTFVTINHRTYNWCMATTMSSEVDSEVGGFVIDLGAVWIVAKVFFFSWAPEH